MKREALDKRGWKFQELYGSYIKMIYGFDGRIWWTMLYSHSNVQIFRNRIKGSVIETELKYDGKCPANISEFKILSQLLGIK